MDLSISHSQAAPDIRFFRNTGVALIASAAIAGAATLTLTLQGNVPPAPIIMASNPVQPVTPE